MATLRSGGRVAVVGAVNLDLVVSAARLPAPGETVVGGDVARYGGGKGANAAVAAARAGARVQFVGAVGRDAVAEEAEADLRDAGVDCAGLARLPQSPTGMALIVVDPAGENQIAVGAGANAALDPAWVSERLTAAVAAGLDCVLVSTEIPPESVTAAVTVAAGGDVRCILNPAPALPAVRDALERRPVLTPNRGELAELVGMLDGDPPQDASDPAAAAQRLNEASGAPVLVTLGGEGALMVEAGQVEVIPAPAVAVRDATGAGDTFNGVLAAGLAGGATVAEAARVAVAAASLSVQGAGARGGMPVVSEIEALMARA